MFARALGLILQVEVFHLDRLFWQCGWKRKTWHTRKEILEKAILGEERWIVDGNYLGPCELHLKTSDTIIFLDLFPLICLWRLIKRHLADQTPRLDIPEGCIDRITFRRMMKVISFSFCGRKMIEQALSNYSSKHIIRLRSRKEVKDFLVQQKRKICFCPRQKSHNILSH